MKTSEDGSATADRCTAAGIGSAEAIRSKPVMQRWIGSGRRRSGSNIKRGLARTGDGGTPAAAPFVVL